MAVAESLVQVTVVAGPPVEIQVRVNRGLAPLRLESTVNVIPSGMVMSPARATNLLPGWIHTAYYIYSRHALHKASV